MGEASGNVKPTIVIPAFNRRTTLERLLKSLQKARGIDDAHLILSIDWADDNHGVLELANNFEWPGYKEIITHSENKGLKDHILWCGDLSEKYGAVIVLEDDLLVSPLFYLFALRAVQYYQDFDEIAGISLYSYNYNESVNLPFYPIKGSSSVYFMQYASSWGQVWTRKQWSEFKTWYTNNKVWDNKDERIPLAPRLWPERSWKKYFIKYLIDKQKYIVYPYLSLTTNFGTPGANSGMITNEHQALLNILDDEYQFEKLGDQSIVYDAYFQIGASYLKEMQPELTKYEFTVDLYGDKPKTLLNKANVLTSKKTKNMIMNFGLDLYPPEMNIAFGIEGKAICLTAVENARMRQGLSSETLRYYYKISDWFWGYLYKLLPSLKKQLRDQVFYRLRKLFRS